MGTSPKRGSLILLMGFRPGSQGWCGPAIYFAKTPQDTYHKAIGPDSHKGFIIEAQVDLGRSLRLGRQCTRYQRFSQTRNGGRYDSIVFNPADGDEFVVFS